MHKLKRRKSSRHRLVVMDPAADYGTQLRAAALPQAGCAGPRDVGRRAVSPSQPAADPAA